MHGGRPFRTRLRLEFVFALILFGYLLRGLHHHTHRVARAETFGAETLERIGRGRRGTERETFEAETLDGIGGGRRGAERLGRNEDLLGKGETPTKDRGRRWQSLGLEEEAKSAQRWPEDEGSSGWDQDTAMMGESRRPEFVSGERREEKRGVGSSKWNENPARNNNVDLTRIENVDPSRNEESRPGLDEMPKQDSAKILGKRFASAHLQDDAYATASEDAYGTTEDIDDDVRFSLDKEERAFVAPVELIGIFPQLVKGSLIKSTLVHSKSFPLGCLVMLIELDQDKYKGVVVNIPLPIEETKRAAETLRLDSKSMAHPVENWLLGFGGPVRNKLEMWTPVHDQNHVLEAIHVDADVFVSGDAEELLQTRRPVIWLYGEAVWLPGQLEREITEGLFEIVQERVAFSKIVGWFTLARRGQQQQ